MNDNTAMCPMQFSIACHESSSALRGWQGHPRNTAESRRERPTHGRRNRLTEPGAPLLVRSGNWLVAYHATTLASSWQHQVFDPSDQMPSLVVATNEIVVVRNGYRYDVLSAHSGEPLGGNGKRSSAPTLKVPVVLIQTRTNFACGVDALTGAELWHRPLDE